MFSGTYLWASLIFLGVWWVVAIFGGGALLLVGAKFIVKTPRASYWRSVWAMFLGTLGCTVIARALSLFTNMNPSLPIIGLVLGLLWTWLIIGWVFKISLKKSFLAWLPALGFQILITVSVVFFVLLPALSNAKALAISVSSASNLRGIGLGIHIYAASNNDVYPPSFDELIQSGFVTEDILHHPSLPVGKSRSYFYLPPKKNVEEVDSSTIIACEKKNLNSSRKGRNVLFADGLVKFLSPEEFAAELTKPHNAAFATALKQADRL